jgi:branched-chain amino acid transport system permease protein
MSGADVSGTGSPVANPAADPARWINRVMIAGVLAFVAAILVIRHGPALWVDAEQARLCRMLIPALYPEDDGIQMLASEAGAGKAVHIAFRMTRNDTRQHLLTCRFGGTGYSAAKRDLISVQLDGVGLGASTLYFLRQGWLETQDSILADPGAPQNSEPWLEVSHTQAVALQHALNSLPRTGILALLALATALIYGLIGRINLAFGEFVAVGGIATSLVVFLCVAMGITTPLFGALTGILVTTGLCALFGAVIGRLILWPLSGAGSLSTIRAQHSGQPIIVAGVGLLVLVQEGLRLTQGAGTIWLPPASPEPLLIARAADFDVIVHARLIAMAALDWMAVIAALAFMAKSRLGRAWQASADDPLAASLIGIDPRALLVGTSALATALAGLAGASVALNYGGIHFSGGTMLGLTALMAAILGGIGSLGGAVLAAALIAGAQGLWSALNPIAHWELASFLFLTLMLILKPGGFFGFPDGAHRKA